MARFGIEEEFILLDEESLVPVDSNDSARLRAAEETRLGKVMTEYLSCQIECATDPVSTLEEADTQVRHLREIASELASSQAAVAASSGTPFASTRSSSVFPSPHYDVVASHLRHITRDHEVNGLHVHVEVADAEGRLRALNRTRSWLPVLLALTGNSPFADGLDSGFASWRSIVIRRLPSSWCPPHFHDLDDYRARVTQLIELGAVSEAVSLSWAVRLSERFPTVEVRIFDAQLSPEDTLLASLLTRAIVLADDLPAAPVEHDAIDASIWTAARHGTDARVMDPMTGEIAQTWDIAARMLAAIRPVLAELGDEDYVTSGLDRIRRAGTGAQRQLRAYEARGIEGIRDLYRGDAQTSS